MKAHLWSLPLAALILASCAPRASKPDGSGTIECTQVRIAAEVGGRMEAVGFEEGDTVTNGQVLARIDPTPYRLRLDEARAALAQAQAQSDLMKAGSRAEDVRRAQAQVWEANAAAQAASADARRIAAIFAQGSASAKQQDDAKAAADRTAATALAASEQSARIEKGNRPEEIRAAQAAADLAKARAALAEKALADCLVTAPLTGVVTTKSVERGEVIAAGTPLAILSRLDEVWLSLYLPETRLPDIKLGRKVMVTLDGDRRGYEGTVTFISPEAEFTPRNVQTPDERAKLVYRIKVTLSNPNGTFKPGMPADGTLQ